MSTHTTSRHSGIDQLAILTDGRNITLGTTSDLGHQVTSIDLGNIQPIILNLSNVARLSRDFQSSSDLIGDHLKVDRSSTFNGILIDQITNRNADTISVLRIEVQDDRLRLFIVLTTMDEAFNVHVDLGTNLIAGSI